MRQTLGASDLRKNKSRTRISRLVVQSGSDIPGGATQLAWATMLGMIADVHAAQFRRAKKHACTA
jgi:hypothetical protein